MTSAASWPRPSAAPEGTAYFCVRDGSGMGVSFIQSNYHGIGARISAGRHRRFSARSWRRLQPWYPGHPNELQPGRRPLHTLSPTLWTRDGNLQLLLGTRGGQYQPQTLLQVAANRFWAGVDSRTAQERPPLATGRPPGGSRTRVVGRVPNVTRSGFRLGESRAPSEHGRGLGWPGGARFR